MSERAYMYVHNLNLPGNNNLTNVKQVDACHIFVRQTNLCCCVYNGCQIGITWSFKTKENILFVVFASFTAGNGLTCVGEKKEDDKNML